METTAGGSGDGGAVLPSSSSSPPPSATPSPTDGGLDANLSDADYFLDDANAVSTVAILCGSARCPPFGRKPQDDESMEIPEATGVDQVTTSPDISASSDTGDANTTEKKLNEGRSSQNRKMVPAMAASFAQQQQQPERQFLAPPPPLPHRNRSYENLRRDVPAPPLPPRAHEYPPALPPRERSHTFSDIPADDLPPYVDPIEEAMAAVAAAEDGADSDAQNSTAATTLSTASGLAQSQPHSRPQQPPAYNTIAFNLPAQ
ncbi:hypothetical protein LPJ53_005768 [Coemansia erecta]|uniref:Uncharacterized protein n=1 Tax=Coemansia erecta TaxID=147472 RepID=A0A9W7XUX3_9FUNG|nr:hypothetical protein LPJ53_005768 [Coemansia erecta]